MAMIAQVAEAATAVSVLPVRLVGLVERIVVLPSSYGWAGPAGGGSGV
ncbi:hypothetical protein [Actinomadura sp. CNU-125]|nr:hypothetical protein [Actinomadura sp. CNU-125]